LIFVGKMLDLIFPDFVISPKAMYKKQCRLSIALYFIIKIQTVIIIKRHKISSKRASLIQSIHFGGFMSTDYWGVFGRHAAKLRRDLICHDNNAFENCDIRRSSLWNYIALTPSNAYS